MKRIGTIIILLLIISFSYLAYSYITYRSKNAVSDASFIKSNNIAILSFKVSGKVIKMYKEENQAVKKGEVLAKIDPIDLENAKEQLIYKKALLTNKIKANILKKERLKEALNLKTQIVETTIQTLDSEILANKFQIQSAQTRVIKLQKDRLRFKSMLEANLIAQSDYETIKSKADSLSQNIEAMKAKLKALQSQKEKAILTTNLAKLNQKQIIELDRDIKAMRDEIKALESRIDEVNIKIGYTILKAPFDGVVAKKFFDAPRVVAKGSSVYAISDPKSLYCEVLLSENKLHGVKVGNSVTIDVDAIKDREFKGEVESISPTSASTFSLVPRDIASGEFTKLAQRFKIRIHLNSIKGLRAGMGASVAIKRSN